MEPLRKPITVNDLSGLTHAVQNWSQKGFQTFLESGFASDIREGLRSQEFDFHKVLIFCSGLSKKVQWDWADDQRATFPQFQKLLSCAPVEDRVAWGEFCMLVFQLSCSVTWWETTASTWEKRDEFRHVLGLKALNPILQSTLNSDLKIIFKSAGHCSVWKKPPTGYRYATLEELTSVKLEDGFFDTIMVGTKKCWEIYKHQDFEIPDFRIIDPTDFFHDNVFKIPLVKIQHN